MMLFNLRTMKSKPCLQRCSHLDLQPWIPTLFDLQTIARCYIEVYVYDWDPAASSFPCTLHQWVQPIPFSRAFYFLFFYELILSLCSSCSSAGKWHGSVIRGAQKKFEIPSYLIVNFMNFYIGSPQKTCILHSDPSM